MLGRVFRVEGDDVPDVEEGCVAAAFNAQAGGELPAEVERHGSLVAGMARVSL